MRGRRLLCRRPPASLLLDTVTVVGRSLTRVDQLSKDPSSWEYEDNNGTAAVLTWTGDVLYGHINMGEGDSFVIEPTGDSNMVVLKEEDTSAWKDDEEQEEEDRAAAMRDAVPLAPHLVEQGRADTTTIATFTVTVYVTKTFKKKTSNYELFIQQVIDETNQGYINSGAKIRIALHCIQETDIADGQKTATMLSQLRSLGSFNEVRKSADTAILLANKLPDYCGMNAFDVISSGGTLGVVAKSCALGYLSLIHI